ncbi:MAG TPA: SagB/ThcOx family dehydrogenase [Dehalococcoidia bacterium]|nr:SagB/ThcOx family dehydrogenase [Dehalococcoidia bacterium]
MGPSPATELPAPSQRGTISVEEAIASRYSVRSYRSDALSLGQLSQVLWAAQGLTKHGGRAAPSAGATYPLEIFVLVGKGSVQDLAEGVYRYYPRGHRLDRHREGDLRAELSQAALNQRFIREAPVSLVVCADYQRTARGYGRRAERYVPMEAGHVGQNVHLQAVALGLGTVMVGAFHDEEVARAVGAGPDLVPLYIFPLGKPR